jgi:lysine 6-dehydrogenase
MKYLVIGSGQMGSAMAYDLVHSPNVEKIVVADKDEQRARELASRLGKNVEAMRLDIAFYDDIVEFMEGADVAFGASSYTHNFALTKAAIEAGTHFCDLGGNMDVVDKQIGLHKLAKEANVTIVPNCGLAPGMACVIAAGAAAKFEKIERMQIRVGGLPQHPQPPLNYQLVFSPEGLINEYLEPAEVVREGKLQKIESMTDIESLQFPKPFEKLEAFSTSGGTSTLGRMFRDRVRDLDYKTIRYPGHCERFKTLLDLGFAGAEPLTVGGRVMTVREFFESLLVKKLPHNGPDVVLVRVSVTGTMEGAHRTLAYELVDYYDTTLKMTSMMRTTSFPTTIIGQMVANGTISGRGVFPPEQCVPLDPFLAELKKRNIVFTESVS